MLNARNVGQPLANPSACYSAANRTPSPSKRRLPQCQASERRPSQPAASLCTAADSFRHLQTPGRDPRRRPRLAEAQRHPGGKARGRRARSHDWRTAVVCRGTLRAGDMWVVLLLYPALSLLYLNSSWRPVLTSLWGCTGCMGGLRGESAPLRSLCPNVPRRPPQATAGRLPRQLTFAAPQQQCSGKARCFARADSELHLATPLVLHPFLH